MMMDFISSVFKDDWLKGRIQKKKKQTLIKTH